MQAAGAGGAGPSLEPGGTWRSSRLPMRSCSEKDFLDDLCTFLRERGIRNTDPQNFPDAILNGRQLDLYNLYRWVTESLNFLSNILKGLIG